MADETIPTTEEVDAPEPIAETPAEEPEAPEVEPSQLDYKAIAEMEKKRADDAIQAAADLAFKLRKGKREEELDTVPENEPEPDLAKPVTALDVARMLDARDADREKTSQEAQALELARKNTTSEDEAQAAFQTWRSRVQPSGDLEADVLFAIGGVHSRRIAGQSKEVQRARASTDTVSTDTAETHLDAPEAPEVKISPQDASAIKAAGMSWDGAKRVYKKSLQKDGKGKFLYYDPKTKKRWVA